MEHLNLACMYDPRRCVASNTKIQRVTTLLDLLLGTELVAVSTLLLSAVHSSGVQAGVAPSKTGSSSMTKISKLSFHTCTEFRDFGSHNLNSLQHVKLSLAG
ncbi:hypothetical protein M758_3G266300 [Ceratodon purpureus]|uniref:Uncharacterized protein n=1 Tax=Ceratodon purpureus TaxID=3225 RepID=A0A8T0IPS8_CERPU|nr:hypothetical protein KC19_3G265600 [Ceratodon purpureus]KAG0624672.1 hypothetical protein M758_3G266300 [Ceratodon purpureus]